VCSHARLSRVHYDHPSSQVSGSRQRECTLDKINGLFPPLICVCPIFLSSIIHPMMILTHTCHCSKVKNQNIFTFMFLNMQDVLFRTSHGVRTKFRQHNPIALQLHARNGATENIRATLLKFCPKLAPCHKWHTLMVTSKLSKNETIPNLHRSYA
jgi:hypothetical protein